MTTRNSILEFAGPGVINKLRQLNKNLNLVIMKLQNVNHGESVGVEKVKNGEEIKENLEGNNIIYYKIK
jgi:hypothetical protein